MQLNAVNFIPLLGSLGYFIHPSSGVQFLTVSTATGTNHSIVSATYSQCGLVLTVGYFIEYIMMHGTINIKCIN